MLEFIVLGQVPGTSLQLTFGDTVVLSAAVIGTLYIGTYLYRHRHHKAPNLAQMIERIAL